MSAWKGSTFKIKTTGNIQPVRGITRDGLGIWFNGAGASVTVIDTGFRLGDVFENLKDALTYADLIIDHLGTVTTDKLKENVEQIQKMRENVH